MSSLQEIEPRGVAEMYLEAEGPQGLDLIGVEIEDDRLDVAREQQAGHDLAEATEAGDDDGSLLELLGRFRFWLRFRARRQARVERQERGSQHHGQGNGQGEQRFTVTGEDLDAACHAEDDEGKLAS